LKIIRSFLTGKFYPIKFQSFYLVSISVFYVFYDQYLTIWRNLLVNLALSFSAVFIVTCILLGFDFHTSFLIILCVFMIISDMFGVMYLWNIQLNAISVVNIIMVRFIFFVVANQDSTVCFRFSLLVLQLNFVLI
jgi:hypothetical protein